MTITANYVPLTNEEIRIKYPAEIAEKFIRQANEIDVLTDTYDSDKFAINIKQNLYITRKKNEADFIVSIANNAETRVAKVKEFKDPANTHKYSFNSVIVAVGEGLKKKGIKLNYRSGFNKYVLKQIIDFYNIKEDLKYAYPHMIGNSCQYTYSQEFVSFIVDEIGKNPDTFVESLKRSNEKR